MATHPVPPTPPAAKKPTLVGTESHPFIGREYPGARCTGQLGFTQLHPRHGEICDKLRSEPIHEDHLNWCSVCDGKINTMTFKGSGVCSEIHRKQRDGEPLTKYKAVAP